MEGINVCCMTTLPDFYGTGVVEATSQGCDRCGLRSSEMPGGLRAGRGGFCLHPFPRRGGGGPFAYGTVASKRTNVANSSAAFAGELSKHIFAF